MTDTTFRFGQNSWQVDSDLPSRLIFVPYDIAAVRSAGRQHASLTQQPRGCKGTSKSRPRHITVDCPVCHELTIYLSIASGVAVDIRHYDLAGVEVPAMKVDDNGMLAAVRQVTSLTDGRPVATVRGKSCHCTIDTADCYNMLAAAELAARPEVVSSVAKVVTLDDSGQPVKARRGRPPGAKNVDKNAKHSSMLAVVPDAVMVTPTRRGNTRSRTLKVGSTTWLAAMVEWQDRPIGPVAAWPDTADTWVVRSPAVDYTSVVDYMTRKVWRAMLPAEVVPAEVAEVDELDNNDSIELLSEMELMAEIPEEAADLSYSEWGVNE